MKWLRRSKAVSGLTNVLFYDGARRRYKQALGENHKWIYRLVQMKAVSWMWFGRFYIVAREMYCLYSIDVTWAK